MSSLEQRIQYAGKAIDALRHSLAGPLQSALNSLFLLRRKLAAGEPVAADQLDILQQHLTLLSQKVDALGGLPSALRKVCRRRERLAYVAAAALARLGEAERTRIELTFTPRDGEGVVDAAALALALHELLKNALEEAPPPQSVQLTLAAQGGRLTARVEGPSAGSWPSPPELAMDPLFSSRGRSLGLGLPIAHAVARSHGGALHVRAGERTAVELELPEGPPDVT